MESALPTDTAEGFEAPDSSNLGKMLYDARKKKGWTLEEAGKAAGIGRSTLSKIENDQTKPSFEVVRRLTKALELETPQLFLQSDRKSISGRRDFTLSGNGERKETPTYDHELLCGELTSKRMLPYISTIKARDVTKFETWIRHGGEEFLYVISGQLTLFTEHYKPLQLKEGDSAYYDAGMGHCCVSTGKEDAKILWVSLES